MERLRADAGDTLVEILVALAVLSIGIVALVGALGTNITATVINRDQSQAESVLASAAEYVKGLQSIPLACPTPGTTSTLTTTEVPRSGAYDVTYGPARAVDGQPCSTLIAVPIRVTQTNGSGFVLEVDVVKRS